MDPLETKTPRPTFTQQGARCPRSHFAQEESQVATCRVKHIVNPGRKKIEFFFFPVDQAGSFYLADNVSGRKC